MGQLRQGDWFLGYNLHVQGAVWPGPSLLFLLHGAAEAGGDVGVRALLTCEMVQDYCVCRVVYSQASTCASLFSFLGLPYPHVALTLAPSDMHPHHACHGRGRDHD